MAKNIVHGIHFGFHENSWDYAGLVVPSHSSGRVVAGAVPG